MDEVIEILKEMGAENVEYQEGLEQLVFYFGGKRITLRGVWHNDSTAGICGEVTEMP